MKLQIYSRPKKISLKLLREAAEFFANHTFPPRLKPKVVIFLKFVSDLWKNEDRKGDCEVLVVNSEQTPRTFIVRIDSNQSVRNILRTVAHEIVHCSQYSSGRLKDYSKRNRVRWEDWVYENIDPENDFDYYLSEWEINAFGMEEGLYRLFMKYGNYNLNGCKKVK